MALTLKPKFGPTEGEEATAYDAALSLTGSSVAGYWRPSKDNFLSRINREQLLAIGREVLGEAGHNPTAPRRKRCWSISSTGPSPIRTSQADTRRRSQKLKSWLPQGMSFDIAAAPKPAKAKKARKAA